jgi:hypothetical protein
MSRDLSERLRKVLDSRTVKAIQGCVIPAPPHAEYPGNHLFVNCFYDPLVLGWDAAALLATARADAVVMLRCLIAERAMHEIESVCLTFLIYPEDPPSPDEDVPPCRIYRYNVVSSELNVDPEAVNLQFLLSNALFLQSSRMPEISQLIEDEPKTISPL